MKRLRFRGFLYGYLLCALMLAAGFLAEQIGEVRRALAEGAEPDSGRRLLQALGGAFMLALCSIPIRILLGLFPEPSTSAGVVFVRRILIGALCGPLPVLTVVLLSGDPSDGEILSIALLCGALVGLGDSLDLQQDRTTARDAEI